MPNVVKAPVEKLDDDVAMLGFRSALCDPRYLREANTRVEQREGK